MKASTRGLGAHFVKLAFVAHVAFEVIIRDTGLGDAPRFP